MYNEHIQQGGVQFVLLGQNRSSNQRSRMILEFQIHNFGAPACAASFHFQKIPGGPNINTFCENWHEASCLINPFTTMCRFFRHLFQKILYTSHTVNNHPISLKSSRQGSLLHQLSGEKNRTSLSFIQLMLHLFCTLYNNQILHQKII